MCICAIVDCGNGTYHLDKWKESQCATHNVPHNMCQCEPRFKLFTFPTERKNPESCLMWTKLVNRKMKNGRNWIPCADDRVCSRQFVDGRPTTDNPHPMLHLGYGTPRIPKMCPMETSTEAAACNSSKSFWGIVFIIIVISYYSRHQVVFHPPHQTFSSLSTIIWPLFRFSHPPCQTVNHPLSVHLNLPIQQWTTVMHALSKTCFPDIWLDHPPPQ